MPVLLRGQIYWADLNPAIGHEQAGRRPVLILTESVSNADSDMAIVVPVTGARQRVGFPYAVRLRSVAKLRRSWALPRQIRAVSGERFDDLIGRVSNREMRAVARAVLRHILPPDGATVVADYPELI